jgi:hypothetical protein
LGFVSFEDVQAQSSFAALAEWTGDIGLAHQVFVQLKHFGGANLKKY